MFINLSKSLFVGYIILLLMAGGIFISSATPVLAQITEDQPPALDLTPPPLSPEVQQALDPLKNPLTPGGNRSNKTGDAPADLAGKITNVVLQAFGIILQFINNYILSWVIMTAANWLNGLVAVTNMANNYAVIIGWTVLRDFANMFFIFIMLIISIATILRFEEYGVRRLLFKVIIVALLINFSRLFAFGVIDFSHVFLNAFLNAFPKTSDGGIDIAGELAKGMSLTTIFAVPDKEGAGPSKWWEIAPPPIGPAVMGYNALSSLWTSGPSDWRILSAIAFNTVILTVIAFTLLAATLVFIVRILWLWFLVMVAPIAFMAYMFPWGVISSWWSKWWSNLFKWAFVAPIFLFFIYITVIIIRSGALGPSIFKEANQATATIKGLQVDTLQIAASPPMLLQMVIIAGFLIGGIMMALQMSGAAGQFAIRAGKWAGAAAVGGAAWVGRKGAARAGRWSAEREEKRKDRMGEAYRGPGLFTQSMARLTAGSRLRERTEVEAEAEKLKRQYGEDKTALQSLLLTAVTPTRKAAIAKRLDDVYGGLKSDDPNMQRRLNAAAVTASNFGMTPKSRPDLAPDVGKAVARLSKKDMENLQGDAITSAVASEFLKKGPALLGEIASVKDEETKAMATRMKEMMGSLNLDAQQFVERIKNGYDFVNDQADPKRANPQLANWIQNSPGALTIRAIVRLPEPQPQQQGQGQTQQQQTQSRLRPEDFIT